MEVKRKQCESRISGKSGELVDVDVYNVWNAFKNGILEASDKVCGNREDRGIAVMHGCGVRRSRKQCDKKQHIKRCVKLIGGKQG